MKHVRIANNIWQVSAADLKRFGGDVYALKMRSKSACIVFSLYGDEWFRSSSSLRHDSSTLVTSAAEKKIIASARHLHE